MEGGQKERAAQIKVLAARRKKKLKIECKTRGATNQSPKQEQQKEERSKQYEFKIIAALLAPASILCYPYYIVLLSSFC